MKKTITVYTWGAEYHHMVVEGTHGVLLASERWAFAKSAYHTRLARLCFFRNGIEVELFEGGKYTDGSRLSNLTKKMQDEVRDKVIGALEEFCPGVLIRHVHFRTRNVKGAEEHDLEGGFILTLVNGSGYGEDGVFVEPGDDGEYDSDDLMMLDSAFSDEERQYLPLDQRAEILGVRRQL